MAEKIVVKGSEYSNAELSYSRGTACSILGSDWQLAYPKIDLNRALLELDKNKDGRISLIEFSEYPLDRVSPNYQSLGSPTLFSCLDINKDNAINRDDDMDRDERIELRDQETFEKMAGSDRKSIHPYHLPYPRTGKPDLNLEDKELLRKRNAVKTSSQEISPRLVLYEVDVPVNNLAPKLEGLTILHLSDLHFTASDLSRPEAIQKIAKALKCKPDIVVITGDVVSYNHNTVPDAGWSVLSQLAPSSLKYFVRGNHDNGSNPPDKVRLERICGLLKDAGYADITNRTARVLFDGEPLDITGIDEPLFGKPLPPRRILDSASVPRILLTHSLDAVGKDYLKNIDLILSGHTHSGEVNLILYSGIDWQRRIGSFNNTNDQIRGVKLLGWRTTSYISPGLEVRTSSSSSDEAYEFIRRYLARFGRFGPGVEQPGATLLTLRRFDEKSKK